MAKYQIEVNGQKYMVEAPDDMPEAELHAQIESQFAAPEQKVDPQLAQTRRTMDLFREMRADDAKVAGDANPVQNWLVGAFQGLKSPVDAGKQMLSHSPLVSEETGQRWRQDIAQNHDDYSRYMGDSSAAQAGNWFGQGLATLPLGAAKVAGVGYKAAIASGALQGGLAGLLTPTEGGGNFWGQKAGQAGTGAALGSVIGAGGKALIDGAQAVANAPRKLANMILAPQAPAANQPTGTLQRIFTGTAAGLRRGDKVAADTGIALSPGERSNSGALKTLENVARQSIWTRDKMAAGDLMRSRQMNNAIRSTARGLSPNKTSPEQFATDLQGSIKKATEQAANARSATARTDYGAVEQAAGGAKIIKTDATLKALAEIVDDWRNVQGADAQAIARQAEAFFNTLKGDGSISAKQALNQMQAWAQAARTGSGLFEGVQERSTARTLAGRLARALQDDMDNTAAASGGSVGDLLRKANANWKTHSQQIDAMEASALGRLVGEDFTDTVNGVAFNKVSPEALWKRLDGASASELQALKQYVSKMNPDLWAQYQRLTLERAHTASRATAPSRGTRSLGLDPGAFVKSLEGSSGQKSVDAQKRLQVIFGDNPRLASILDAGRRMADSTGRNFSNTAPTQEVLQMPAVLEKVAGGARAAAGALGPLYGLRTVANRASLPVGQRALPMLEAPAWVRGVPSYLAPMAGGMVADDSDGGGLSLDITGGTTGPAISQQELDALRRRAYGAR